jgi:hypothetical protein
MATDVTEFVDTLRDKTDVEVVFATLASVSIAEQQAPDGPLGNCLAAARASVAVLLERFVPIEIAGPAFEELYGDDTSLTLIQGGA